MNNTPNGHVVDATTHRVCILASHPDIADAYGSLPPEEIISLGKKFGIVEQAGLWIDSRRFTHRDFVSKWRAYHYTLHPLVHVRKRLNLPYSDMRIQAMQFTRAFASYQRTVILIVNGGPNIDLIELINEMHETDVRVILCTLDTKDAPIGKQVDLVVPIRAVLKGTFDLFEAFRPGIVDKLQQEDSKSYELFSKILSTRYSSKLGKAERQLRTRMMMSAEPIPPAVLAMLPVLSARAQHADKDALVPLNAILLLLKQHGIQRTDLLTALRFMLEEGTLTSQDDTLANVRYNLPADDPVFTIGSLLWEDFQVRRPHVLTVRMLAAVEAVLTGQDFDDNRVEEDLKIFLALQHDDDMEMRHHLYHSWGLDKQAILEFERQVSDLLASNPEAEDTGPRVIAPKLAACLPANQANDQGSPNPTRLRQAS